MLSNYLKTAYRNLMRYKGYSAINVFGLTIGLTASIFIFLWVYDELSYDRYHKNIERIYLATNNWIYGDGHIETAFITPVKLGDALERIPEIEKTSHMTFNQGLLFRYEDKAFEESGIFADPSLFEIFTMNIIQGKSSNPLPDHSSIAISEKVAMKYFGRTDVLGESFRVQNKYDLKITAVYEDMPHHSTLRFDFVIPFQVWRNEDTASREDWNNNGTLTLVMLREHADATAVSAKTKTIIKENCSFCLTESFLFPYGKIRLYNDFENGEPTGSGAIAYVINISLVAVLTLAIACINFMNLATARAATRMREVGVRKVVGAQRSSLLKQFLGESILLSFLALLIALGLIALSLPLFNAFLDKSMQLDFSNPVFVTGILLITLFCGFLAGSYPAFFLSSFKPTQVLKTSQTSSLSGSGLRKTLVIVQFMVSIVMIVGSIVIYRQINYILNKDLGFEKENVIVMEQKQGIYAQQQSFKSELLGYPEIKSVSMASNHPFNVTNSISDPTWPGKPETSTVPLRVIFCDQDYISTLGMALSIGRDFRGPEDSTNFIFNEKSLEVMGIPIEEAVGTPIELSQGALKGKIIGVVKNFNNGNLREEIHPLMFFYSPQNSGLVFVKVTTADIPAVVTKLEQQFRKFNPENVFEYSFLDQDFERQYDNENFIGQLALSFTVIAVLISCLGLFGMSAFTAERRMKELGIRKVFGATVQDLVLMLGKDFVRLVIIALMLGLPISFFIGREYLSGYAYHEPMSVGVFAITAVIALVICIVTVGWQSAKAALNNPITSLRNE